MLAGKICARLGDAAFVCSLTGETGENLHFRKSVGVPTINEKIILKAQRHQQSFSFDSLPRNFHKYFCKINYPESRFRPFSLTLDVSILRLGI